MARSGVPKTQILAYRVMHAHKSMPIRNTYAAAVIPENSIRMGLRKGQPCHSRKFHPHGVGAVIANRHISRRDAGHLYLIGTFVADLFKSRRRLKAENLFLRDRRLGDLKAEHQQLAMDPRRSPLWVFLAHASDEISQVAIDLWPSCFLSRLPVPERLEARVVPSKDGLRLNDPGCVEQARPEPGHPDQQCSVAGAQSKTRRRTPQSDAELMAKKQVLSFKPAAAA